MMIQILLIKLFVSNFIYLYFKCTLNFNINFFNLILVIKSHQVAGGKLDVKKAISRSEGAGGGRGGRGGRGGGGGGGGNRSSWGGNPRNEQWGGGHHNSKYKSLLVFSCN